MECDNYRILSSSNINELEEMINKASADGFKIAKFNDNKDPDNWQGIAIMESIEGSAPPYITKQLEDQLMIDNSNIAEMKNILNEVVSEGSAPPYITNKIKDLLNNQ